MLAKSSPRQILGNIDPNELAPRSWFLCSPAQKNPLNAAESSGISVAASGGSEKLIRWLTDLHRILILILLK